MRSRVGLLVFAALLAVEAALVPAIDRLAPDVTRAWRVYPIEGLRDGRRVVQTFDIGYHGLDGIDLPAPVLPSATARYIDVRLAGPDGTTAVTRQATVVIAAGSTACCRVAFDRIPASGRRFQLQLTFRGFTTDTALTLPVHRVRTTGGLRINGRALPANLVMEPDGDIEHLPGVLRVSLVGVGVTLLALDALVGMAAGALVSAYRRPRP